MKNNSLSIIILSILCVAVILLIIYIIDVTKKVRSQQRAISHLAHDLKSPITSTKGFVQAMQDGIIEKDDFGHYFGIINGELDRMNGYITMVNDSVKLENGKYKMKREIVDISSIFVNSFLSLEERINKKSINVTGLDNDKKLVYADSEFLVRAVYNIVDNAVKYTDVDGYIKISYKLIDNKLMVSVRNSGNGLSHKECKQIFRKYYRTPNAINGKEKGLGLGLGITRKIIELNGGSVVANGEKGKYAEFVLTLPSADCKKE